MLNGPRDLICSWEPCSTVLTKITLSACAWYVNTCIHFWNLNANPLVKILKQSNLGQIIVNTCSFFVAVVWKCIVAKIWNLEPLCLNPKKIYHDQFSMEIKLLFLILAVKFTWLHYYSVKFYRPIDLQLFLKFVSREHFANVHTL